MSVLIKNWEAPKKCLCSPLCYIAHCTPYFNGYNPSCPIVEIKTPHGRLIDENELIKRAQTEAKGLDNISPETFPFVVEWLVGKCNTVIESEE